MITLILIAMVGLVAITLAVISFAKGRRANNRKSGAENRAASDDPTVGRASGLD